MTTTDEARVTDAERAEALANPSFWEIVGPCWCINGDTCRHWPHVRLEDVERVITALADRLAARDAEVAAVRCEVERFKILAESELQFNQNCRDTIAKLRAERAEAVALLERSPMLYRCAAAAMNQDFCETHNGATCSDHERRAMLAKLRTP